MIVAAHDRLEPDLVVVLDDVIARLGGDGNAGQRIARPVDGAGSLFDFVSFHALARHEIGGGRGGHAEMLDKKVGVLGLLLKVWLGAHGGVTRARGIGFAPGCAIA